MGGLLAFRVGNYDNTAEREQFRFLCEQLKAHYENSNDFCVFVGNYNIGCELDALVIKKDAIIAIEFKNYGGNVIANENGAWTCDGTVIKGGSRKTVLQQARINHSIVKKELKVLGVESKQIKDVPTLVVFHRSIELTNNLSATNKSWLHITDDNHFIEKLDDITCPYTDLDPLGIVNLAELLNLNSFYLIEFSNAVYDKQKTTSDQLQIFKDVKSFKHQAKESQQVDIHSSEELLRQEYPSQTISTNENDKVLTTPKDLVSLRNYAIQIVQTVCKRKDCDLQALKYKDFLSAYPNLRDNICQETIIFVNDLYDEEEKDHLSRFLKKKIFTIDETHFFWQSGDYITPIHPYNIKQEENALEAPSTTLASDLPEWLDNYIFNILNAKYSPDHVRFEYNLNLSKEEVLIYLGTYFPRSYIEINSLFTDFSKSVNYTKAIEHKTELKIMDLGCGTGGDIFGLLNFIEKTISNVGTIKLLAIDGNQESLRVFEKIMSFYKTQTRFCIDYTIGPTFIENKDDLDAISEIVSEQYDIVLSCKSICEMLAKNRLTKKSYKSTVNMLASKLSKEGILFIEDITIKSPTTNVFIPIILNRELNEFVRENNEFVTLYPHSCLKNGNRCFEGCFFKRVFHLSHSRRKNDVSKVIYRFIGRKNILSKLCITDNNIYDCKIS